MPQLEVLPTQSEATQTSIDYTLRVKLKQMLEELYSGAVSVASTNGVATDLTVQSALGIASGDPVLTLSNGIIAPGFFVTDEAFSGTLDADVGSLVFAPDGIHIKFGTDGSDWSLLANALNVAAAVNALIAAAPGALDTLDELAAALGDDANFAATVTTALAGKQATITGGATTIATSNLTASRALASDGSGKVAVTAVTATELGYVAEVTSAIQTQLNAKQATITGAASSVVSTNLNAEEIVISDGSGKLVSSGVPATTVEHLAGVTSGIQDQLDTKLESILTADIQADGFNIFDLGIVQSGAFSDGDNQQVVGIRQSAIPNASGGAIIDAEARAAINTLLASLRTHGLIAT